MTYETAMETIMNEIRANNGHMIGTLKDGETEYNVNSHEGSEYVLVYESESGFYLRDAINDEDLRILAVATNPKCVVKI